MKRIIRCVVWTLVVFGVLTLSLIPFGGHMETNLGTAVPAEPSIISKLSFPVTLLIWVVGMLIILMRGRSRD